MPRPKRSRAAALKAKQRLGRSDEQAAAEGSRRAVESPDESYDDSRGRDESSDDDADDAVDHGDIDDDANFVAEELVLFADQKRSGIQTRNRRRQASAQNDGDDDADRPEAERQPWPQTETGLPPPPRDMYKIPAYPQDGRRTRMYAGPLKKWDRYRTLVEILYGPDAKSIGIIDSLRYHWMDYPVLPRRTRRHSAVTPAAAARTSGVVGSGGMRESPWLPDTFESDQTATFREWCNSLDGDRDGHAQPQQTGNVHPENGQQYLPQPSGDLVALLGPPSQQQAVRFQRGTCLALQDSGAPMPVGGGSHAGAAELGGWLLDAGGIVMTTAWAPRSGEVDQLLALAVLPHQDQEPGATETDDASGASKQLGSIQFWNVSLRDGPPETRRLPRLERVFLFDWGRPLRMQWCPVQYVVPVAEPSPVYGILALLTSDGIVRVIKVRNLFNEATQYDWIEHPVATLDLPDEYNVSATCLTWIGINRIVLGHSDGSLSLWSVDPQLLLLRTPVHATRILDVCSGYPSFPYMVASYPVGGVSRLVDLMRPSSEHTFHPSPMVAFQPGLLQWTDHLQGFIAAGPGNNPLAGSIDFLHVRFFSSSRTILPGRGQAPPICLSVGASHPFALVGRADGSLWSCNMLQKLCRNRTDEAYRLKIFESEFRPLPPGYRGIPDEAGGEEVPLRGAVRILQGFETERNELSHRTEQATRAEAQSAASSEDGSDTEQEASQSVIHDPLTRISAVAWNPNITYGWWAAIGMASGLVRIMELGVEPP